MTPVRQDQKAAVVYDLLKVRPPHIFGPPEPSIARLEFPGRRRKLQASGELARRSRDPDQIPQVRSVRHGVSKVVVTIDELARECSLGGVLDEL